MAVVWMCCARFGLICLEKLVRVEKGKYSMTENVIDILWFASYFITYIFIYLHLIVYRNIYSTCSKFY